MKINSALLAAAACAALSAALAAPRAALAEGTDQLWEVTSKMSMPDMPKSKLHDMPEGMAGGMMSERKNQICRSSDVREEITKNKKMEDCSVAEFKEDGNSITMDFKCKKGRGGKMEIKYNKDRTAYTGTMHMTDEGHEMQMTMNGKKIGTCDAKVARAEREAKVSAIKAQAADAQAQYKEMARQTEEAQIKGCDKAVKTMKPEGLGYFGICRAKKNDDSCKTLTSASAKQQPKVSAACTAGADLLCKRYQTHEGFLAAKQANTLETIAEMCAKPSEEVRVPLCKSASKAESWEFVGAACPDTAKPLVKAHCAGRSYTVKEGDPRRVEKKWFRFCVAVAGSTMGEDETASEKPASHKEEKSLEEQKAEATEEAKKEMKKEAIGAGLKKLSGLFGH